MQPTSQPGGQWRASRYRYTCTHTSVDICVYLSLSLHIYILLLMLLGPLSRIMDNYKPYQVFCFLIACSRPNTPCTSRAQGIQGTHQVNKVSMSSSPARIAWLVIHQPSCSEFFWELCSYAIWWQLDNLHFSRDTNLGSSHRLEVDVMKQCLCPEQENTYTGDNAWNLCICICRYNI